MLYHMRLKSLLSYEKEAQSTSKLLDFGFRKTWSWEALTHNFMNDNIRPIMPKGDGEYKVLLWLRGSMKCYSDYDFDVVRPINP